MPRVLTFLTAIIVLSAAAADPTLRPRTAKFVGGSEDQRNAPEGTFTAFAFDDHTIPFKENLKLTLAMPDKHPANPVVRPGPPGSVDELAAQFYGSVIRVGFKFRMWYVAISREQPPDAVQRCVRIAYAESDDGIRWVKPELGLVPHRGSARNNLVRMTPEMDCRKVEPLACFVLYEPDDPDPARRYKMAAYGRYRSIIRYPEVPADNRPSSIYPYFSADGLDWKLALPPPKGDILDESEVPFTVRNNFEIGGLYKFDGFYYVAGQELWPDISLPDGRPIRRTMVTHWSGDFIHWSNDKSFSFQRSGYRSVRESLEEAHEPAAVWNRGNVLVGLYGLFHGATIMSERRMDLGLLVSNDGIHFREPIPDRVIIPAGKDGSWDQRGLLHGQGYENVGDQTYIYYGSWDISGGGAKNAIGLATLRRDRLGYLSTYQPGGARFTTCPLPNNNKGASLYLNVDGLDGDSTLAVELTDRIGKPIPGFSEAEAALVRTSGLRVKVVWGRKSVLDFKDPQYRVRVKFTGPSVAATRFYAAYIE
jgi:hypothetical protein